MTVSRREFLTVIPLSVAGSSVLASSVLAAPLGSGTPAFAEIVRQIGGVGAIPEILVEAAEQEFLHMYGSAARAALVDVLGRGAIESRLTGADPALRAQIQFIARFLYTGEVERGGMTKALYYPWCLSWSALTFASAPGLCGGPAFGHWSHAPLPGAM